MKKIFSKAELLTIAQGIYQANKEYTTLFAREDGNIFLNKNRADLDAQKMKIYEFGEKELSASSKQPTAEKKQSAESRQPTAESSKTKSKTTKTTKA